MMETVTTIPEIRELIRSFEGSVALVPTMGALHGGHRACIELACQSADATVVSIFLNPTQFGPGEDLDRYPVSLDADLELCRDMGCRGVFVPSPDVMYPEAQRVWVDPGPLATPLCGRSRPGHFRGVCTVVAKLLEIVRPDIAVFGQKDAQQALLIQEMVQQLNMALSLRIAATVREPDGLAMSSRNALLSEANRVLAPGLYRALRQGLGAVGAGEKSADAVVSAVKDRLAAEGIQRVEYVELRSVEGLTEVRRVSGRCLLAAAVHLGETRLIDNIVFSVDAFGAVREQPLF